MTTFVPSPNVDAIITQGNLRDYAQYIAWEANSGAYHRLFCEKELERGDRDLAQLHLDDARKCDRRRHRWERQAVAAYYELHSYGARSYEELTQPTYRTHEERYRAFIENLSEEQWDHLVLLCSEHEMEE